MFTYSWLTGVPRLRRRVRGVPASRKSRRPAFEELEERAVPAATDIVLHEVTATPFSDFTSRLVVRYEIEHRDAAAFDLSFYRSTNTRFDAADTLLSRARITALDDLDMDMHTKTFDIGTAAGEVALPGIGLAEVSGDYFVLAVADPRGRVSETDAHPFREDNTAILKGIYYGAGVVFVHGVHGGPPGDSLTVSPEDGHLRVELNGAVHTYAAAAVTAVRARLHAGDDALDGTTAAVPLYAWGGDGNDSLVGGAASDFLHGGAGDDQLTGTGLTDNLFFGGDDLPPPGGVTVISPWSDLASAEGRTWYFSGFNPAGLSGLWWGPNTAGLSMDGPVDVAREHLSFYAGSDLENGVAEWRGTADFTYFVSIIPPIPWTTTLTTRLMVKVTDLDNDSIPLIERSDASLPGSGAVVEVAVGGAPLAGFKVNLRMEALWDGDWWPAGPLFDSRLTWPTHYVDTECEQGFWYRYVDNDVLTGGDGNDTLTGALGNDRVAETARKLRLEGTTTAATLYGRGIDTLRGVGLVSLTGTAAANELNAKEFAGRVELYGKAGDDTLYGGSADADWLSGGPGNDYLNGGGGRDWVYERANVSMTLTNRWLFGLGTDRLVSIESGRLFGGPDANVLNASAFTLGVVWLWGEGGNDVLIGTGVTGIGDDLLGGAGNDTIRGGAGNDVIQGEAGKDNLLGGVGDDHLLGGEGNDHLDGGDGSDRLDGGPGDDTLLNGEEIVVLP